MICNVGGIRDNDRGGDVLEAHFMPANRGTDEDDDGCWYITCTGAFWMPPIDASKYMEVQRKLVLAQLITVLVAGGICIWIF